MCGKLNVLVTGGAGYIGSHTCKYLYNKGYSPVVYDNLSTGHRDFVKSGEFIFGDLQQTGKIIDVIKKIKPVAVIHFAASAYVGESVVAPSKYYNNNVCGTLSLLEAMRIAGLDKIVFSSSCATYGEPEEVPVSETCRQLPVNPYGRSKHMVEQILMDFEEAYDIKHVALRYFNAAGADPDGEIGERHDPETHIIPLLLQAATADCEFKIFGNDYDTPDGTCIRDYIHVQDLALAHIKSLEYLISENQSNQFNLGNGQGYSVEQIIETVKNLTGNDFSVSIQNRRQGDPPILVGDSTKAKKVLGWKPEFNDLNDIISSAWNWHKKENINLRNT
jgi:UDP-glucose 4-epimerase